MKKRTLFQDRNAERAKIDIHVGGRKLQITFAAREFQINPSPPGSKHHYLFPFTVATIVPFARRAEISSPDCTRKASFNRAPEEQKPKQNLHRELPAENAASA